MPHQIHSLELHLRIGELRDAFQAAWKGETPPSISDYLRQVDAAWRDPLFKELLLLDLHHRHEQGQSASIDDYLSQFPGDEDLIRSAWPRRAETTAPDGAILHAGAHPTEVWRPDRTGRASPESSAPSFSDERYSILQSLAQGGLGRVSVALDREFHRQVALKQMHEGLSRHSALQDRFVQEATITGQLEHPNIVPVYSLGADAHGDPYYAMRLIQGMSLADAIVLLHSVKSDATGTHTMLDALLATDARQRDSRNTAAETAAWETAALETAANPTAPTAPDEQTSPTSPARLFDYRSLAFRALLNRLASVCQAVAFAHSRGVLHRDIKPANIMLGDFGQTLLVDWGLAKLLANSPNGRSGGSQMGRPASGANQDVDKTSQGDVCGTAPYMSPEQANGHIDQLGPAADIYSLGATLYELITCQRPYQGRDVDQILEQVRRAEFPRPREVQHNVPAALEAICLKAMSKLPADRYLSARHMAEDLERYLADEPVCAYAEPLLDRGKRWLKRHPTLVGIGIVSVVLGMCMSMVLTMQSRNHNSQITDKNKALTQALAEVSEKREQLTGALAETERQLRLSNAQRLAFLSANDLENSPNRSTQLAVESILATSTRREPISTLSINALRASLAKLGGFPLTTGEEPPSYSNSVKLSPDNRYLAIARDNQVFLFDLRNPKPDAEPRVLTSQDALIQDMVFRSDGRFLFSVGSGQEIYGWSVDDPSTAIVKLPFGNGQGYITNTLCVSSDGRWLAAAHHNEVDVFDLEHADGLGAPRLIPVPDARVDSLAISPLSSLLAVGCSDKKVSLFDLLAADPSTTRRDLPHTEWVNAVAFSPNGRWLAASAADAATRLWDLAETDLVGSMRTVVGHRELINCLAFSGDSRMLATGGRGDREIRIVDVLDVERPAKVLSGHRGPVTSLAFSTDGNSLISGSADHTIRIWPIWRPSPADEVRVLGGHDAPIVDVHPARGGRWLVSGCAGGTARVWDLEGKQPTADRLRVNVTWSCAGAAAEDGALVAIGKNDGEVVVLDLRSEDPAKSARRFMSSQLPPSHTNVRRLAFSPSGRFLLSCNATSDAYLWDLHQPDPASSVRILPGLADDLAFPRFSRNEHWLAILCESGKLRVWDLTSPTLAEMAVDLPLIRTSQDGFVFDGAGERLAMLGKDGRLYAQRLSTANPVVDRVTSKFDPAIDVAVQIVPRGDPAEFLVARHRLRPMIWNIATNEIREIAVDRFEERDLRTLLSSEGSWAVAHSDQVVELLDVRDSLEPRVMGDLQGARRGRLIDFRFSSDGRWLSASEGERSQLWDLQAENIAHSEQTIPSHPNQFAPPIVHSRGGYLASFIGGVELWPVHWPDLLAIADRHMAGRLPSSNRTALGLDSSLQPPASPLKPTELVSWYSTAPFGDDWPVVEPSELAKLRLRSTTPPARVDQTLGAMLPLDIQRQSNQPLSPALPAFWAGEKSLQGLRFSIASNFVQLGGQAVKERPTRVDGIAVGRHARMVHFLHGVVFAANTPAGERLADYEVQYDDGSVETIEIIQGVDVCEHWIGESEAPKLSAAWVAWYGYNRIAADRQHQLCLCVSTWSNPHPDKTIQQINLVSSMHPSGAAPFCVAITVEEP